MKVKIKRLNHVQLCIPPGEEARARDFYGRVLGLEEIEKPEPLRARGGFWYRVADVELHIGVEEVADARSKRHPAFEVEDVRAVKRYLEEQGVQTREEVPVPGVERFSFFDPFGNRIEFLEKTGD